MIRAARHDAVSALGLAIALVCVGCASPPHGADAQRRARYFPAAPSAPRIVYLADIGQLRFSHEQPSAMERFLFGSRGRTGGLIGKPFGLAAGAGKLFVCDTRRHLVHVFDLGTGAYSFFGESGVGRLSRPVAIALDAQGNRYVADIDRGEVVVFSPANEALRALRPAGVFSFKPVGVALNHGELFVADRQSRRVLVMDPTTGDVIRQMDDTKPGIGMPSGIAIDKDGRVLLADALNARVYMFSSEGRRIGSIGRPGDRAGCFARPKHMAVAPDGILYAVDAAFQRVQMFNDRGQSLMLFGGPGDEPGCLTMPAGIAVDASAVPLLAEWIPAGFEAEYIIFVSDQFGPWHLRIYAFGHASDP